MSYILEALKKAQAERQIGNAPTIHAPAPSYAAPAGPAGGRQRTLLIGLGAGAVVAAAAVLWLRAPGEQPVKLAAAPAPAQPAPTVGPPAAPPAAAPVTVPQPVIAPPPAVPEPRAKAKPVREPAPPPKAAPAPVPEPVVAPPQPEPVRVAAAPAPEDRVRSLQELPEALQREIPKVAFGGYIYSPNAAERLLLVDKMLRREGEEVAPGLVLERILPKAAVMNYRGNRYRVGY